MKILYISPSPPNELERIRTLNILKSLKKDNNQITLITLYNKKQVQYLKEAERYADNIIEIKYSKIIAIIYAFISLILPIPARVGYCFNFRLKNFLKKYQEQFDIAYIKRLRMAQYKKYIKASNIYIDITDSLTKYHERLYKNEKSIKKLFYLEEYIKLKRYEIKVCEDNSNIIICSEEDKKYIQDISKKTIGHISVIENVLELDNWYNKEIFVRNQKNRTRLVFLGVMNYKPNIEAVKYIIKNIMPNLEKQYTLEVIGPKVPKDIEKLETNRIKFLGYVDSVKKELERNDIFICPITIGAGVKNKILQAGMVGLPIVCSSLSLEGLNQEIKDTVYIADTEQEFINQILKIQNSDTEELKKKIRIQQEIIKKYNSLEIIEKKLEKLLYNKNN